MVKHKFKVGDMVMVMSPEEVVEVIERRGNSVDYHYDENDDMYDDEDDEEHPGDLIISNSPGYTLGMQYTSEENKPVTIKTVTNKFVLIDGYYWDPLWLKPYKIKALIPNGILTKLFR